MKISQLIAGVIYLGYLLYRACQKLSERLNKRGQDDDDTQPPPYTNYSKSASSGPIRVASSSADAMFYRASFVFAVQHSADCGAGDFPTTNDAGGNSDHPECATPFSYTFEATATNSSVHGYVPTNLVSESQYYLSRGLSTNVPIQLNQFLVSYSVNNIPTNQLDVIQLMPDGSFVINLPNTTNVTYTVQTTTDLVSGNWTNSLTITVPQGTLMKGRHNSLDKSRFFRLVN